MKSFCPRFSAPISEARPKGARLLEGYSPKLGRPIQLHDYANFSVWVGLEADPSVRAFCERPARFGLAGNDSVIDFWVQRSNADESFQVLSNLPADDLPATLHDIAVHYVRDGDVAASQVWVGNWIRILGVITASRGLIEPATLKAVREFVKEPVVLGRLEAQFSHGDPVRIRACIFELLRNGRLTAPQLHTHPLTLYTSVGPAT